MKNEVLLIKLYLDAFENPICDYRMTDFEILAKIEGFYGTSISIDKIIKVFKMHSWRPVSVDKKLTKQYLSKAKPKKIFISRTTWGKCLMFIQYSSKLFERNGSWYYAEIVTPDYFCNNKKYLKIKKDLLTKNWTNQTT